MAINLPGMDKIDELLKKVVTKAPAKTGEENTAETFGLMGIFSASIPLKFMLAAAILLIIALLFLLSASFKIVSSTSELNHVELTPPSMEDYFPNLKSSVKTDALDSSEKILSRDHDESDKSTSSNNFELDTEQALEKAFEFLAKFENKRSQQTLMSVKPVVSNIRKSSPAEDAGLQIGDVIYRVNGAPIESVLGYYLSIADKPGFELVLDVDRKGKSIPLKLLPNGNKPLTATTAGVIFVIPGGMAYVTQEEAKKLSTQYQESFLNMVPINRQKLFANNLLKMTQKISLEGQILTITRTPENYPISKFSTAEFLQWHHQKFMSALDEYVEKRAEKQAHILSSLNGLADALTGLAAAAIAFICTVLYYAFFAKK